MPVHVVEWPEWCSPPFFAVFIVGKQTVVSEEDEYVLAIGCRARRSGRVHLLVTLDPRPRTFTLPENFAGTPVEAKREQPAAFVDHLIAAASVLSFAAFSAGEENQIPGNYG